MQTGDFFAHPALLLALAVLRLSNLCVELVSAELGGELLSMLER